MFTFCSNRKEVDEPGSLSLLTQINVNAVIDLSEEVMTGFCRVSDSLTTEADLSKTDCVHRLNTRPSLK